MTFKQKHEGGGGSSIGNKYEVESRQWGKQVQRLGESNVPDKY